MLLWTTSQHLSNAEQKDAQSLRRNPRKSTTGCAGTWAARSRYRALHPAGQLAVQPAAQPAVPSAQSATQPIKWVAKKQGFFRESNLVIQWLVFSRRTMRYNRWNGYYMFIILAGRGLSSRTESYRGRALSRLCHKKLLSIKTHRNMAAVKFRQNLIPEVARIERLGCVVYVRSQLRMLLPSRGG